MLGKQGILTEKEMQDIVDCLKEILKEVEEGKLIITMIRRYSQLCRGTTH